MSVEVIISYDGTPNDDDALALGKMLARGGLTLALAYVRHSREFDPRREELAQHDADQRLERGAALLGDPDITRRVVFGASTGAGLEQLAAARKTAASLAAKLGATVLESPSEPADLIVVGSAPGAPAGRIVVGGDVRSELDRARGSVLVLPAG